MRRCVVTGENTTMTHGIEYEPRPLDCPSRLSLNVILDPPARVTVIIPDALVKNANHGITRVTVIN